MNGLTDREKACFARHKALLPPALVAMVEAYDKAWNRSPKGAAEAWFQVNVSDEMPAVPMHLSISAHGSDHQKAIGINKVVLSIG